MRLVNVLALASAAPLVALTVTIGALNWWNGQRSAQTLGFGLGSAISEQVRLQLDQLLAAPRQVNSLNVDAIAEGRLNPEDFEQMVQTFSSQMKVFSVDYINYGSQEGDYIGIERLDTGHLQLNITDRRLGPSRQFVYAIGPGGPEAQPLQIIDPIPSATEEAWYRETARAGQATWSSIYQWDDKPEVLSISYNQPVLRPDGRLRGVIGIDFTINQLNHRLARIWGRRPGVLLITERNGMLVASSSGNTVETKPGQAPRRRRITESSNRLEQEASRLLFHSLPAGQGLHLDEALIRRSQARGSARGLSTDSTFIDALPWSDRHGLNWLVLVIIPKQSLTAEIRQQTLLTTLLGLTSLIVLLLLSNRVTHWILRPLRELSEGARQLGVAIRRSPGAPLELTPGTARGSAEEITVLGEALDNLISTFNGMVAALRRTGNRLERELQQKAAALDRATRREQEALETSASRERFLGHLGRELLQPVADLRGATRLALSEPDPVRLADQLARLDASARSLERLAQTLRDRARIADGSIVLRSEPVDLPQLLDSTVAVLGQAARNHGQRLSWRLEPGTPQLFAGDRERLAQVLEHLLARAIRAGGQGEIWIEGSSPRDVGQSWLVLQIGDCGGDSDIERLRRCLTPPGRQACPDAPDPLEDLGLSVCGQLLALMGARVTVEHRAGRGTVVSLQLPIRATSPPIATAAPAGADSQGGAVPWEDRP
jgi:signal transduction histidine kinase